MNLRIVFVVSLLCISLQSVETATAQSIVHHITVPNSGFLGFRVANAGDVDGDEVPDLLVADLDVGTYIFSGADAARIRLLPDHFHGVASAGDVNGDGLADTLVSNEFLNSVRVYSGADGELVHQITSNRPKSVAPVGDVNLDGFDDFAVGEPVLHEIRIHSGLTGDVMHAFTAGGEIVRNAGDVNADGFDDLVTIGNVTAPRVQVFSAVDGGPLLSWDLGLDSSFGISLAGAGDLDGDEHDDLLVGNWLDNTTLAFSGADGSLLHALSSEEGFGLFGWSVCAAGDVNLDGKGDFAVREGFEGIHVYSGADASRLYFHADDSFSGWQIAFLGDVNGDGFPELFSGNEEGGTHPGNGPGYADVITPCPLPPHAYCDTSPSSAGPGARMGSAGTPSRTSNDFMLVATDAVPGEFGLFFYGAERSQVPFGDGERCVAAGPYELFRPFAPLFIDSKGSAFQRLPIGAAPGELADGDIAVGALWHFQFWYRDPGGPGGTGFNLSDGLAVTFCP